MDDGTSKRHLDGLNEIFTWIEFELSIRTKLFTKVQEMPNIIIESIATFQRPTR